MAHHDQFATYICIKLRVARNERVKMVWENHVQFCQDSPSSRGLVTITVRTPYIKTYRLRLAEERVVRGDEEFIEDRKFFCMHHDFFSVLSNATGIPSLLCFSAAQRCNLLFQVLDTKLRGLVGCPKTTVLSLSLL